MLCCTKGIKGRTPYFHPKLQNRTVSLKLKEKVGPGTFQGPLEDCPVPESPSWRGGRQAGVGPTKLSHPSVRLSWAGDQLGVESQNGIEGRTGILRGGEAAHSPFISVSSRKHVAPQASPCYQLAQGPWGVPGRKDRTPRPPWKTPRRGVTISGRTTQLLSLGEETTTSPLLESILGRWTRTRQSRLVVGLLHFNHLRGGAKSDSKTLSGLFCSICQSFMYSSQWPQGRSQTPLFDPQSLKEVYC